jgi:hypothetical protein
MHSCVAVPPARHVSRAVARPRPLASATDGRAPLLHPLRRPRGWPLLAAAIAFAGVRTAHGAAEPPRVVFQGTLALPERAPDEAGNEVVVTGLSGIAWLGDDRYVAVMDNSVHVVLFRLALSQAGKPLAVADVRVVTLADRHDYEDVVPCPAAVAESLQRSIGGPPAAAAPGDSAADWPAHAEQVLLCEEDTPAIRGFSLADGSAIGVVPLPENLGRRRPNRGLESLAIEPDGRFLWTANEEALSGDGPTAAAGAGTVVRLTRISLPVPDATAVGGTFQAAYGVDKVHQFVPVFTADPLSGVSALVALGGGRLLVLERSGAAGLPPFSSRIYLVDVDEAVDVSAVERDLAARKDAAVAKRLLWSDSLGVNLEGLCVGPRLVDGSRALLGIADNGGIGTPNQLVGLSLVQPAVRPDPAVLGAVAALVVVAIVVGRLTSP